MVVPTLFSRPKYLKACLESVQKAGNPYVILMGPNIKKNATYYSGLFDELVEEPPLSSLSAKLNVALCKFPTEVEFIAWIGDDDLLAPGSLIFLEGLFRQSPDLTLAYGACNYIDSNGDKIGRNRSGPWALKFARVGPFLAPQPGSLFRRSDFMAVGGLDSNITVAFDYDLFIALSGRGLTHYTGRTLSSFRWHANSLSVAHRKRAVREASYVRDKYASRFMRLILKFTNPIVELATFTAGSAVNQVIRSRRGI